MKSAIEFLKSEIDRLQVKHAELVNTESQLIQHLASAREDIAANLTRRNELAAAAVALESPRQKTEEPPRPQARKSK
jgi:uncharacterized membrane-anchored protein YhcB (DUF1043 family)